jgi:DNA-binding CsgD family transcriptional regulator
MAANPMKGTRESLREGAGSEGHRVDSDAPESLGGWQAIRLGVLCACGMCCSGISVWLLNASVFPTTSSVFPFAREFQTLAGLLLDALVLVLALKRSEVLRPGRCAVVALVLSLAGTAILLTPGARGSELGVSVGLVMFALASGWMSYPLGMVLGRLGPTRVTCTSISAGIVAGVLVSVAFSAPSYQFGVIGREVMLVLQLCLLYAPSRKQIESIALNGGAEEIALANPRSFLPANSTIFILMFAFNIAFGFALSFHISDNTPITSGIQLLALAVTMIWFLATVNPLRWTDALFGISATLVESGYVLTLVPAFSASAIPNGLLSAGSRCFSVLSWLVSSSLCHRNPSGAFVFLALGGVASSIGTFVGADLGHLVNALSAGGASIDDAVVAAMVVALFAYAVFGLRKFSFVETIEGIVPAVAVTVVDSSASASPTREEAFDQACETLAQENGLTKREAEVLGLLARGHNGHHIEDVLTLSYNTVKTHVKRIYRKLDVHSQQELIDLVDARANELAEKN